MKILSILIIVLSLSNLRCTGNKTLVSENIKQQACLYFLNDFNYSLKYFGKDTLSFNKSMELTKFNKMLNTPFKKTKFFQFSFEGIEPVWKVIAYECNNEDSILTRGTYNESDIITDELIVKFNNLLKFEEYLNNPEILEVIKLMFYLKYYREDGIIILKNWDEIANDLDYPIPQNVREMIKPIEIIMDSNAVEYKFYCWDIFSSFLYNVDIRYTRNGELKFFTHNLGKFGIPSLTL